MAFQIYLSSTQLHKTGARHYHVGWAFSRGCGVALGILLCSLDSNDPKEMLSWGERGTSLIVDQARRSSRIPRG